MVNRSADGGQTLPKAKRRKPMKNLIMSIALMTSPLAMAADMSKGADNFYKSDKVTAQKVTFKNQYKMEVVGIFSFPRACNQNTKNPAIVVGHPMGAVKEQSANLYAQKLADRDSSPCPWICLSGERARGSLATRFCRMFMPRISVLRWISWAPGPSWTGPDWCSWDLRQWELCHQRGQDRPAHESHRDREHV